MEDFVNENARISWDIIASCNHHIHCQYGITMATPLGKRPIKIPHWGHPPIAGYTFPFFVGEIYIFARQNPSMALNHSPTFPISGTKPPTIQPCTPVVYHKAIIPTSHQPGVGWNRTGPGRSPNATGEQGKIRDSSCNEPMERFKKNMAARWYDSYKMG